MDILDRILEGREKRSKLREFYSAKGYPSLSLTLNIPGYPKSDKCINYLFNIILKDLIRYLQANRVFLDIKNSSLNIDEAGDFFIASIISINQKIEKIKDLCESFEKDFYISRIVDIDITDERFNNISSNKLKTCYICKDLPAVQCMKENRHTKTQLRDYLFEKVDSYLEKIKENNISTKLTQFSLKAILYEVSLSPKPGSVDRFDSGIHKDMDFFTYINSSAAISLYFIDLIRAGYSFNRDMNDALPIIRNIGLKMEEEMFIETGGVNTQKGIIFLFGISLFSIAYILRKKNVFDRELFVKTVKCIAAGISDNELVKDNQKNSHGEKCFKKYGLKIGGGIRNEVENGLPTVIKFGLPVLRSELKTIKNGIYTNADIKNPLISTLMSIMANNNDTNILYRGGEEKLKGVKDLSSAFLNLVNKDEKMAQYDLLMKYCEKEKISPGGSADLLALTILLYFVEQEFITKIDLIEKGVGVS